ncbi:Ig-like domain-containing protein [Winogradskyella sp. SYSU M77433]|uniref:right-handed parallel beta-helix repeat-containing protein n=1 Tax=Winogradskyella sp. SYSU M77433 TaxID=3042722 RepID=UPI002480D3F0|nr:Ig-like domain-containing protein [Winogradskyella sp. SYSU M77433]MDH7911684.1 Ig-like domain-containing protein [Winogradskyella sp. SYSU M77433]
MKTTNNIVRFLMIICVLFSFGCSSDSSDDTPATIAVSSITITGDTITDGSTSQLSVTVQPSDATNSAVSWTVSNSSVATISNSGLLSAVSNGTVVVRATAQDGSGVYAERTFVISGVESPVNGTVVETPEEVLNAIYTANPGEIIYVREGDYVFNSTIQISGDGSNNNLISLLAYPSDANRPRFNFSSMSENSSNRGIQLSGDYWHIKGIDVFGAGDNGMHITGSNNLIEFCTFSENKDSGLQIGGGGSNNTILNCDSFYNADSSLENADGFACKLDAGSDNKFIGCRAWQNLDDGWDGYLRDTDNITTYYENCWAFKNGYLMNGTIGAGDGNGFKTGGSDDKTLKHNAIYKNCIAAGNVYDGFDHNSNRGDIEIYNCSAYSNGRNINFGSTNVAQFLLVKNTASFAGVNGGDSFSATTVDITSNGWQNGITTNASDFVAIDIDLLASPRNEDGSLPDIDFLKLVAGSDLIDAGEDVGLPFNGSAPDIGAFEYE